MPANVKWLPDIRTGMQPKISLSFIRIKFYITI